MIWDLASGGHLLRRHRSFGKVYSVLVDERRVVCGGEGGSGGSVQSSSVGVYNWRDGCLLFEAQDEEAPKGMTTCMHRSGALLAAGNSDTHSQLRVWDLRGGGGADSLVERVSLPPYVKGVRCVTAPTEQTLLCGTTNGWVVQFDMRTGRYERKFAHSAVAPHAVAPFSKLQPVRL